jgi:S1-C subfamily serine protease
MVLSRNSWRIRFILGSLIVLTALIGGPAGVRAQVDPLVLGRAIDATVQLSIVVHGVIDGEESTIWYAVGSGTVVSSDGVILTNQHLITPDGVDTKLAELEAELAALESDDGADT